MQANQSSIVQDKPFYRLMLVTQRASQPLQSYLNFIERCAQAGITAVQLREKSYSDAELVAFGKSLQAILKPYHIPLLINDNLRVALEIDADGVHLGQTDGDPLEARKILGPHKRMGLSIDSMANLQHANTLPLDYVGIGSIFMTHNKTNVTTHWGLAGLAALSTHSKHPIVAIGGIHENNVDGVYRSGAHGIAAIGAFHDSGDLKKTIQNMRSGDLNKDD